jgi:alpha-glucosidase
LQLVTGGDEPVAAQDNILLYRRVGTAGAIVIALNLGADRLDFVELHGAGHEIMLSTRMDRQGGASKAR